MKRNFKKEILQKDNYYKYILPYRHKGLTEHEAIEEGLKDFIQNEINILNKKHDLEIKKYNKIIGKLL